MSGIQSVSALPGDPTFNEFNNRYDVASSKRIWNEFGISPSNRFTHEKNNGVRSVFIYGTGADPVKTGASYPEFYKFSYEGGEGIKGNLIYFIEPHIIDHYDWFAPSKASGLHRLGSHVSISQLRHSFIAFWGPR